MKISPDAQLFEKQDCSLFAENQKQQKFIRIVPSATDCLEVYEKGWKIDGVYGVCADDDFYRPTLCRMSLYGGGWTVFQNRFDGSLSFKQKWKSYKIGFGDLRKEFWYGNDMLHNLTFGNTNQLLVYMKHRDGVEYYPLFNRFNVESESNKYQLSVGEKENINKGNINFTE